LSDVRQVLRWSVFGLGAVVGLNQVAKHTDKAHAHAEHHAEQKHGAASQAHEDADIYNPDSEKFDLEKVLEKAAEEK